MRLSAIYCQSSYQLVPRTPKLISLKGSIGGHPTSKGRSAHVAKQVLETREDAQKDKDIHGKEWCKKEGHPVYEQRRVDLATFRALPASTWRHCSQVLCFTIVWDTPEKEKVAKWSPAPASILEGFNEIYVVYGPKKPYKTREKRQSCQIDPCLPPPPQQFTYGVLRKGVIAESFLQISAKFPQAFLGSQHPSPNVKTFCKFEPQIWLEFITSRDAKSACFKGSRTSCREIFFGIFWPSFGRKRSHHVMDASCRFPQNFAPFPDTVKRIFCQFPRLFQSPQTFCKTP